MTVDEAVALSLVPDLPRVGLTERLRAGDPDLVEAAARRLDEARAVRARAEAAGLGVVAWSDPRFPASLLATSDLPPALWYRGALQTLAAPAVAIVGSRAASATALEVAARLAADLALRGIVVVSGLARGVDSAAHRGALREGRTIAVLGSGVDRVYPREHVPLAKEIAGRGLVVSEYPPGTPPLPFHFPMRNRLISGLACAVVVVEASERSGSLITAACALEQGREVMAVPGNVLSGRNRGAHALIRDGAKIVECADDIVEDLGWVVGTAAPPAPASTASTATGSGDPLLRLMRAGEAYDLDGLAASAGVAASRLLPRLLELELRGLVERIEGGRFMRPTRTC
ncbi:MAG: DNA protecting protein DprA [Acidobacteria bacterium RIFCSPLOWO2_02_FULL_68_18]|nr:MAG: DNA protecting protein DprA [Acidobacteria bacterium RIFCSPLOWO2_02_FULL_68_18]OFW50980.1 MAG: DNA protecting protein DprA [Acidobacteria bacterium RIFCSPLOWO2_12_FULL_68_19]